MHLQRRVLRRENCSAAATAYGSCLLSITIRHIYIYIFVREWLLLAILQLRICDQPFSSPQYHCSTGCNDFNEPRRWCRLGYKVEKQSIAVQTKFHSYQTYYTYILYNIIIYYIILYYIISYYIILFRFLRMVWYSIVSMRSDISDKIRT